MIKGVIFDLDGVIVSTDDYHYQAWKKIADKEEIPFGIKDNDRLRGVSRMESLDIILEKTTKKYTDDEKVSLATDKNEYYKVLLKNITEDDILTDVLELLRVLKERGIATSIGSSSRNAKFILKQIGLFEVFDQIADGTDVKRSKPFPDIFLVAADKLNLKPEECVVVEDAVAGIIAAKAANMKALAIGDAINAEEKDYSLNTVIDVIKYIDLP